MSAELFGINFSTPVYFHREYKNDVEEKHLDNNQQDVSRRVVKASLPFINLYKPLNFSLSIGLSAWRSFTCISQLKTCIQANNYNDLPSELIKTMTSISAFAAAIIVPPVGMLITTIQDLVSEIVNLEGHLNGGRYKEAMESCFNIANNALYLSLFCIGGLELTIASLAAQTLLGAYHAKSEFRKGNYIEATGHALMAMIRCKQMSDQVKEFQQRQKEKKALEKQREWFEKQQNEEIQKQKKVIEGIQVEIQELKERMVVESEAQISKIHELEKKLSDQQELQQVLVKYGNNPDGVFAFHYAIKMGDRRAVDLLLQNGADVNSRCLNFTALFLAVRNNQMAIARELIDKGADVNATIGVTNLTAISSAAYLGNVDMVNLLIANGAVLNPPNVMTPLDIAAVHGRYEVVVALLNNGANIQGGSLTNGQLPMKWATPLDRAASNLNYSTDPKNLDLIKYLVEHGALRSNKMEVPCPVINGYLKSVNR